ncbi:MAG: tetratricopeptide repeat protein [Synechococcaceae cyanobacterium SM2_3_1]|nr:tetratricopeptide repeat protein [Synechococcaceae cyanobacterium SM2_3_1]
MVPRLNSGLIYTLQGDYDTATSSYQTVIDMSPENPEGHYQMGTLYVNQDRFTEAIPYFAKAESLYAQYSSPHIGDAHLILAVSNSMIQQCDQAILWKNKLSGEYMNHDLLSIVNEICGQTP